MPLVGDIIMSAREQIPDMPQTMGPPNLGVPTANPTGGNLAAGTWYFVLTLLTPWGETLPSNEVSVTVPTTTPPNSASVSIPWGVVGGGLGSIAGARIYIGTSSGGENHAQEYGGSLSLGPPDNVVGIPNPIVVSDQFAGGYAVPPATSNAYLPDTGGKFINNYTMYRWLNEGLNIISKKTGGILDASGVPTVIGQPNYQLPRKWITINKMWFDGWELIKGTRSDIFYRNAITAIANLTVTLRQSESSRVEIFPQPNRTAGSSVVAAPFLPTDTTISLDQTTGWVLPFGLAALGDPMAAQGFVGRGIAFEVVAYANAANSQLNGIVRGLGGTDPNPVPWPVGTPVRELNLRISGYRMAQNYVVGRATETVSVPDGWCDLLPIYMDSKALSVQGDKSGAAKRMQEFLKYCQELASASQLLQGPVQIGLASTNEVYNPGLGGGWYLQ